LATQPKPVDVGSDYKEKYGFFVPEDYVFKAKRGLNPDIVKEISFMKGEPEWMTKFRLRSLEIFRKKPMPTWGADLSVIDFENIFYYLKASDKQSKSWEELPADIKATYDRLVCLRRSASSWPACRRSTSQRSFITHCRRSCRRRA